MQSQPIDLSGIVPTKALLIAGTNGWRDGWCTDPEHDFPKMLISEKITPIRRADGRSWRWSTALDGLLGDDQEWIASAEALADYLELWVPLRDRNLIAHSHGGNVAARAAQLVPLNTLTTVGTPCRDNIDYAAAAKNIVYWQHIHDAKVDAMGWLGKVRIGDWHLIDGNRAIVTKPPAPNIHNCPIAGIGHSKILRDAKYLHYWRDRGWLSAIRTAGIVQGV